MLVRGVSVVLPMLRSSSPTNRDSRITAFSAQQRKFFARKSKNLGPKYRRVAHHDTPFNIIIICICVRVCVCVCESVCRMDATVIAFQTLKTAHAMS